MTLRFAYIILSLQFVFLSVYSQEVNKPISFRDLTVEQGLSQNSVVSIAQDSTGYLWFATQDGLNKYDGREFEYFNLQFVDITRPDFSRLGKVYVDTKGEIYCIDLDGKLLKYNKDQNLFKTASELENISTVLRDSNGDFFIGTYGDGLFKIQEKTGDTLQLFSTKKPLPDIYALNEFNDELFIAAHGGLYKFNNSDIYQIPSALDKPINYSSYSFTRGKGLFIGSFGNGLFLYDENTEKLIPFKGFSEDKDLPQNLKVQDLLTDHHNRLWVATYGQGVFLLDFKKEMIQHFLADVTDPFALHYNDVLCLFQDQTNTIWLGTDGAGLSYFDEHLIKFRMLTNDHLPDEVNVDVIRSITTDNNGNIWIGTSGKGLTLINPETKDFKTLTASNSALRTNRIMSLYNDKDELWIGHQAGGLQLMNEKGNMSSFPELKTQTIWKIYPASEEELWLCTRDEGLIRFNKREGIKQTYNSKNSKLKTSNIRTIEKGPGSTFFLGTEDEGLYVLDVVANSIQSIEDIPKKIKSLNFHRFDLWIGTNGNGLYKYEIESKKIDSFTVDEGLSNNVIYGILIDENNHKWLSTNKGIVRINIADNKEINVVNFSPLNGLQAFEFNTGAYYQDGKGMMYFGGLNGINWFQPNHMSFNEMKPKTVISKFEIFNEKRSLIPNLELAHNENTVTFTFAGLHFSQPQENLYKYKLENHDSGWSPPSTINTAHYTNLPPDDYTFKVVSSNYEGVWNQDAAEYKFTILQPWYATLTAKIIYGLLFIFLLYSIYSYFKWRWALKMQLELEHAEAIRLKKLDDFKSKLYTDISHEFRTPLTLIDGPVTNQLQKKNLSEEDKEELELIKRNSNRLMNLVNQLLDLSKLETGNLKLSVVQDNLGALMHQIGRAFKFQANEKKINFQSDIAKIKTAWFDRDVVEKIVTNLLSNAVKYTPSGGRISFSTQEKDGQLIITVINSGNTLFDDELPRLFQRFYQDKSNSDGMGVGLSLVKELCILSHGNVVANTLDDDRIQFTVTLPIDKSYFHHSEIDFEAMESQEKINEIEIEDSDKSMVLVIDDDDDIRQFIRSILNPEYEVIEASEGKTGIKKAIEFIPDIIICDIMMPGPDGLETTKAIKEDQRCSHIPVILLTAKSGDRHEIKGFETGADAYMTKPFSANKLKIRIENLIEGRKQLQTHFGNNFEFKTKDIQISSAEEQFIERLQQVLDDNLMDPDFNAENFSKKMLMSRMQLHRKLKALTDMSSSEFIRRQRLKQAVAIMTQNNCTISEVAYQVGFNTPSYFIKSFKAVYNCTPTEYLQKTS
ncbi:MAG: response regulator [Bacteroidia bacterium]|nr:response regulator [Bacteroidia bacterium]